MIHHSVKMRSLKWTRDEIDLMHKALEEVGIKFHRLHNHYEVLTQIMLNAKHIHHDNPIWWMLVEKLK